MFFRIGFDAEYGTGCNGQSSRYPALWLSSERDELYLSLSNRDSCAAGYFLSGFGTVSERDIVSYAHWVQFHCIDDDHWGFGENMDRVVVPIGDSRGTYWADCSHWVDVWKVWNINVFINTDYIYEPLVDFTDEIDQALILGQDRRHHKIGSG